MYLQFIIKKIITPVKKIIIIKKFTILIKKTINCNKYYNLWLKSYNIHYN